LQDSALELQDSALGLQDSALREQDSPSELQDSALGLQDSALELQDSALGLQDSALREQDSALPKQDPPLKKQNKCDYCLHTFYNKTNKKRHESICKHRNETRCLEIEMNVKITIPEDKTECRFCKKAMFRTDALSKHVQVCKDRLEYHEQLLKEKNKEKEEKEIQIYENAQTVINNNGTINNGTINNNNTINIFGTPRSTAHLDTEQIIQFLRELKKQHLPQQTYEQAGNLIIMVENYVQEDLANRNFVIPDFKSFIGYTKNEKNWDIVGIDNPLNQQFKETAGILYDKKEEIDNVNDKVFKNNTNSEIFKHVKYFNKEGFYYNPHGDHKIKAIKSNYKITKLKNKTVCDF
jgi:hypothetical protein